MRVLLVTSQFPVAGEPTRGRPLLQTARELGRRCELRVLSPVAHYPSWARPKSYLFHAAAKPETDLGCEVEYVRYPALPAVTRPFNGWLAGRAMHAAAARFAPDVVLSYWLYPDAFGAMQVARRLRVPFVAGARGSDIRVRDALSRRLTKPVVRAASRLLVVSADLGRLAAQEYGADPARVRVIPNGCDAATFRPGDRAAARAALGIAADASMVLYVGRLVPEKGLRELVDAAARLRADVPNLHLVLVGDGPMRAELESLRRAHPDLPITLAGSQSAPDVARWMVASDVVTLPSWSEGHPNVLVEALACGRPVVSTPVGGVPEVVDADCGELVPVRDAGALSKGLARALSRTWDEAALARRWSRDWNTVAADTLAACTEALAGRRTPEPA